MKISTLLLSMAGCLPFTACSEESVPETPIIIDMPGDTIPVKDTTMLPTTPSDTLHYLALGDSYTIGESVKQEERYPVQLVAKLRKDSVVIADPTIIARTGWTTRQLKQAIEAATLREEYQLVSLLIGVNNQYQGVNIEIYKTEFRELLQKAIALAGGDPKRVFVLSIPDYAYTPFGRNSSSISRQIDEYNAINLNIAWEYNVSYFDITPISRKGLVQPNLVASDGLHPSGKMYEQWVQLIYPGVLSKIK